MLQRHQVHRPSERRVLRAERSGPLPQFDLPTLESLDPDRTLERLPRLAIESDPALPDLRVEPPSGFVSARDFEADMASTVEIVPEVELDDIFDESEPLLADARPEPPARALPPLALPPRTTAPFDLDRLLALARAEASKSPEYFQTVAPGIPTLTPIPVHLDPLSSPLRLTPLVSTPFQASSPRPPSEPLSLYDMELEARPVFTAPSALERVAHPLASRTDPTLMLSAVVDRKRRRTGWIAGTVFAVAAVTIGIVAGQSGVSSARAPQSVVITRPASAKAATAKAVSRATTELDEPAAIPAVSVQSLPIAEVGTVSLAAVAASHRLFVDGKLVSGGSVVVSCGNHVVQVGSRGARHTIAVPCGQEIVLAR